MVKITNLATLVFLLSLCFTLPVSADSILNDLAPSVFGARERGPKPEDTLIAPFADTQTPQKADPKNIIPGNTTALAPLTTPHQDRAFMMEWAATQVAGIFTYNPGNASPTAPDGPAAQSALFKKAFLSTAQTDVQTLFALPYFSDRLNANNMQIKAFVESPATIQNEGVFGDVYRWLIDVPVTMTFYPQGYLTDQITRSNKFETKTIIIRVQIARILGEYPDGCAIERFTTSTPLP